MVANVQSDIVDTRADLKLRGKARGVLVVGSVDADVLAFAAASGDTGDTGVMGSVVSVKAVMETVGTRFSLRGVMGAREMIRMPVSGKVPMSVQFSGISTSGWRSCHAAGIWLFSEDAECVVMLLDRRGAGLFLCLLARFPNTTEVPKYGNRTYFFSSFPLHF